MRISRTCAVLPSVRPCAEASPAAALAVATWTRRVLARAEAEGRAGAPESAGAEAKEAA